MDASIETTGTRLEMLGHLASGVAHDFANLLTAMIGASETALARPSLDGQLREDLRRIRADAERGTALVRQILHFGRPDRTEPVVCPASVATDCTDWLRRLLRPGLALHAELPHGLPDVALERAALEQIIANLVLNGRDAIDGDGRIDLAMTPVSFDRPVTHGGRQHAAGAYLQLTVADTGRGIAADVLARIFDPFFTTRLGKGGNGIGLSTVRNLVHRAGGWVDVASQPGATCFTVYLPAIDAPARSGGQGRTVLFVDDEASLLPIAQRRFTAGGWHVLVAEDAETARMLCAAEAPDLAILDATLPDDSGLVLLRDLRRQHPGLPAIITSGYAGAALAAESAAVGAAFLPKPYTFDQLLALADRTVAQPARCS